MFAANPPPISPRAAQDEAAHRFMDIVEYKLTLLRKHRADGVAIEALEVFNAQETRIDVQAVRPGGVILHRRRRPVVPLATKGFDSVLFVVTAGGRKEHAVVFAGTSCLACEFATFHAIDVYPFNTAVVYKILKFFHCRHAPVVAPKIGGGVISAFKDA